MSTSLPISSGTNKIETKEQQKETKKSEIWAKIWCVNSNLTWHPRIGCGLSNELLLSNVHVLVKNLIWIGGILF